MVWVLLLTLGSWREYKVFIVFIDSWFYRRLISVTVHTGMAMRTIPIPVTVGIFEARREHEGSKVTTVTRMEAVRRPK